LTTYKTKPRQLLAKDFYRHLKMVQDSCTREENQDSTSVINERDIPTSKILPKSKSSEKPGMDNKKKNPSSDCDILQNIFDRIPSPENALAIQNSCIRGEKQDCTSACNQTVRKACELPPMSDLNYQPREKKAKKNSDTDSPPNILNCLPSPENGSKTQKHETSHITNSPGSKYQNLWDQKYRELVSYAEEFGHTRVPVQLSSLGVWVRHQRVNYRNFQKGNLSTRMTESRIELLDQIGFEWNSQVHSWETSYEQLVTFATENGHTRVPKSNRLLAYWVQAQRSNYKISRNGDPSSRMTEKRIDLLEKIGFEWDCTGPPWERLYYELVQFVKKFGHSRVPRGFPQNPALGRWVNLQREYYRQLRRGNSSCNLTENRIELLNKVSFEWYPSVHSWDRKYEDLVSFVKEFGHARVPMIYPKFTTEKLGKKLTPKLHKVSKWGFMHHERKPG